MARFSHCIAPIYETYLRTEQYNITVRYKDIKPDRMNVQYSKTNPSLLKIDWGAASPSRMVPSSFFLFRKARGAAEVAQTLSHW